MEILFHGIPLGDVTVSMTINSPGRASSGPCIWPWPKGRAWTAAGSRGTLQNDILKEYIAQKEYIFPPRAFHAAGDRYHRVRRAADAPGGTPISISGYHIREAGSTAAQELAFTLRDGMEYVRLGARPRPGRGRFRSAPELLLQRPQRFLSRRSPSTAPRAASGPTRCASASAPTIRAQSELRFHAQTAGVLAHRAAAQQQRRPHGHAGARRGARRHAIAAHQFAGRGATRCPASRPSPSRCARSRSSLMKAAWPISPIRSAAATSWKS